MSLPAYAHNVVVDSLFSTSPSVYVVYQNVSATDSCKSAIGKTYADTTIAYIPSRVLTRSIFTKKIKSSIIQTTVWNTINYEDFYSNCSVVAVNITDDSVPAGDQSEYFSKHCFPELQASPKLTYWHGEWGHCREKISIFDPPRALVPANALVAPAADPTTTQESNSPDRAAGAAPAAQVVQPDLPHKTAPPAGSSEVTPQADDKSADLDTLGDANGESDGGGGGNEPDSSGDLRVDSQSDTSGQESNPDDSQLDNSRQESNSDDSQSNTSGQEGNSSDDSQSDNSGQEANSSDDSHSDTSGEESNSSDDSQSDISREGSNSDTSQSDTSGQESNPDDSHSDTSGEELNSPDESESDTSGQGPNSFDDSRSDISGEEPNSSGESQSDTTRQKSNSDDPVQNHPADDSEHDTESTSNPDRGSPHAGSNEEGPDSSDPKMTVSGTKNGENDPGVLGSGESPQSPGAANGNDQGSGTGLSAMTINGNAIQVVPSQPNVFDVDGTRVTIGASPTLISGTLVAIHSNGDLILGPSTIHNLLPTPPPSQISHYTLLSGKLLLLPSDHLIAPHTTPSPDARGTFIDGTSATLGFSALQIGSTSMLPGLPTAIGESLAPLADGVVVDGITLTEGGPAVTISGTRLSMGTEGLVVGTATVEIGGLGTYEVGRASGGGNKDVVQGRGSRSQERGLGICLVIVTMLWMVAWS